jgi:hypothetical protein
LDSGRPASTITASRACADRMAVIRKAHAAAADREPSRPTVLQAASGAQVPRHGPVAAQ